MKNHRGSLASMMESVPGSLDIGEPHPVPGLVNACLAELDWVQEGGRDSTREEGHGFPVEAFVVPVDASAVMAAGLIKARKLYQDLH